MHAARDFPVPTGRRDAYARQFWRMFVGVAGCCRSRSARASRGTACAWRSTLRRRRVSNGVWHMTLDENREREFARGRLHMPLGLTEGKAEDELISAVRGCLAAGLGERSPSTERDQAVRRVRPDMTGLCRHLRRKQSGAHGRGTGFGGIPCAMGHPESGWMIRAARGPAAGGH